MLIGFGVLTMWAIKTWRKYLCHRVWCVCLLVDRRWQHLVRRTAVRDQPLILLATACLSSPDHVPRISHSPILTRRTMRHQASNIPHQPFLHATRPPPSHFTTEFRNVGALSPLHKNVFMMVIHLRGNRDIWLADVWCRFVLKMLIEKHCKWKLRFVDSQITCEYKMKPGRFVYVLQGLRAALGRPIPPTLFYFIILIAHLTFPDRVHAIPCINVFRRWCEMVVHCICSLH